MALSPLRAFHQQAAPPAVVRGHNRLSPVTFQPSGSCHFAGLAWAPRPPHAARAHACSADFPQSLRYWESLRTAAASAASSAPEAHPSALAEQWLQQDTRTLAATAVAAPEQARTQVPATAGLVRNRVIKTRRGYWRIRHFQAADLLAVADLQSAAFYEAAPVAVLDKLAFTMFKAEVLDALKQKVGCLSDDSFAMMVVESCHLGALDASVADSISSDEDSDDENGSSSDWDWDTRTAVWYGDQQAAVLPASSSTSQQSASAAAGHGRHQPTPYRSSSIVGVVEIGVNEEQDVIQHLNGHSGPYAYISSMAVSPQIRRSGIGRALLHAAEQQAANWNQRLMALHVYTSNTPAIKLYERHDLRWHAQDPAWKGLLGGKVRQLMVKKLHRSQA